MNEITIIACILLIATGWMSFSIWRELSRNPNSSRNDLIRWAEFLGINVDDDIDYDELKIKIVDYFDREDGE